MFFLICHNPGGTCHPVACTGKVAEALVSKDAMPSLLSCISKFGDNPSVVGLAAKLIGQLPLHKDQHGEGTTGRLFPFFFSKIHESVSLVFETFSAQKTFPYFWNELLGHSFYAMSGRGRGSADLQIVLCAR